MKQHQGIHNAQIPNPALNALGKLVGEWKTVGTHPAVADKSLRGNASFQWIEGGAFLRWYAEVEEEGFPAGIAIFGSDDATGSCLCFILTSGQCRENTRFPSKTM